LNFKREIEVLLNRLGRQRRASLVVISYDLSSWHIQPLDELDSDILFSMDEPKTKLGKHIEYSYETISKDEYKAAFEEVQQQIRAGNTYLLNLTAQSKLNIDASLKEIYHMSDARYKLYFKDQFVCFSPEKFVDIEDNKIYTYPMKGTIDAKIPNAKEKILSNQKEMAEHVMVVDLLRNDLAMVADKIRVDKFRYVEKIKAGERELLQVSSKISGELQDGWQDRLGSIIIQMLPAGSITGAPKKSTVEIINRVENYDRGYFTGIFGVFDGNSFKSSVMIRFVQKQGDELYYKSGGGITIDSDMEAEYAELQEKIYVPVL